MAVELPKILITNDDGINAPGLAIAEAIAAEIAGPKGEVWVIAPDVERSGVSHCISYVQPTRLTEVGQRRYMLDGFPADCVLVGLTKLMRDRPPDLIISDINMPDMDGLALCRRLRAEPGLALVPVLLLTARGETHDKY